jgi:hypothetical protein
MGAAETHDMTYQITQTSQRAANQRMPKKLDCEKLENTVSMYWTLLQVIVESM